MRLPVLILSLFACAWSAFTSIFNVPKDKPRFWADLLNPNSPEVDLAWAEFKKNPSIHLLKNLLVEHNRARPQYWAKVLSLVIVVLAFLLALFIWL